MSATPSVEAECLDGHLFSLQLSSACLAGLALSMLGGWVLRCGLARSRAVRGLLAMAAATATAVAVLQEREVCEDECVTWRGEARLGGLPECC